MLLLLELMWFYLQHVTSALHVIVQWHGGDVCIHFEAGGWGEQTSASPASRVYVYTHLLL